ncbi:hypothetical protein TWF696_000158 [Orbilia brochopaga]|uniref:Uncharacterized protein n=1 Tax=Orbilia brochopaga TaxID=3140254 RepID=A0AAV9VDI7_9PEZI
MVWLSALQISEAPFTIYLCLVVFLLSRINLADAYAYTTLASSPTSKTHSGVLENDGCRAKGEQAGYKSLERMGIVNWKGSYQTKALAFYTSTRCAPSGVAVLARLFDDPYAVQYIDLSSANVPNDLRSFRTIDLDRTNEYGNAIISQLNKMRPGTIYVPQIPGDPTKASYCYGSIVIPPWEDQNYDLSSGKPESWAEYKRAITDLQSLFHDLRKDEATANKVIGIDATEVPWEPGQEDLVTTSDLHSVLVRPKVPLCKLLPAVDLEGVPDTDADDVIQLNKANAHPIPPFSFEGELVEDFQPPVEKRLKTQTFVEPGAVDWGLIGYEALANIPQTQESRRLVLDEEKKEELQHIVERYSGGRRTSAERRQMRQQEREKQAPKIRPQQEVVRPARRKKPSMRGQQIYQPPKDKEPWADFSVLTNPMLGDYLQRGVRNTLLNIASHQIVENARSNYALQATLGQRGNNEPADEFALGEQGDYGASEPVLDEQPLIKEHLIEEVAIEDPLIEEALVEEFGIAQPVPIEQSILEQSVLDDDQFDVDQFLASLSAIEEGQEGTGRLSGGQPQEPSVQDFIPALEEERPVDLTAGEVSELVDFPFLFQDDFSFPQEQQQDENDFARYFTESEARRDDDLE